MNKYTKYTYTITKEGRPFPYWTRFYKGGVRQTAKCSSTLWGARSHMRKYRRQLLAEAQPIESGDLFPYGGEPE